MPKVTWKLPNGNEVVADVDVGTTLMEAALDNDIPEIIGECGGCLSCACLLYTSPSPRDQRGSRMPSSA